MTRWGKWLAEARANIAAALTGGNRRRSNKDLDQIASHNAYGFRTAREAARAAKKAAKAQGFDVFGSNARRAAQAARDAASIAQPVAATPTGAGQLNLRPIMERVDARNFVRDDFDKWLREGRRARRKGSRGMHGRLAPLRAWS